MKHIKILLIMLICFTAFTSLHSTPVEAVEDAIIAIVNDQLITLKDLRDYIRKTYISLSAQGMPDEQLKEVMKDLERDGLNKLIEDKLILSEANNIGLDIREKLVNEKLDNIKKRYESEQHFVDSLIEYGATISDLRNKITDQLKIKYVIEHSVQSQIFIKPQEVTDYYEKNRDKFIETEKVDLDAIFFASVIDANLAKEKAQKAYAEMIAGSDFVEIAKKYSAYVNVGLVERGQMVPVIEDAIFNLTENQISSIIEVDNGYYIFKLKRSIPAKIAKLQDVKDQIKNYLFQVKFQEKYNEWLKQLKDNAFIEIKH